MSRRKKSQKAKKQQKQLYKNAGFSLVEVMIAIVILAVVVTPFLHSFLTSTRVNAKARITSQASTLAQAVFEGLKTEAYVQNMATQTYSQVTLPHLENLAYQFNYPQVQGEKNFFVLPKAVMNEASVGELVESGKQLSDIFNSDDLGVTYTFKESDDLQYYFYILNTKEQNTKFDVYIHLDGSAYTSDNEEGVASSGADFNNTELVKIPYVNTAYDAVCTKSYDAEAIKDIQMYVNSLNYTFDESDLSREITVNVEETDGMVTVSIQYTYAYEMPDGSVYPKSCAAVTVYKEEKELFRSIYLYYYPMYQSTSEFDIKDKIILNNNLGNDPLEFSWYIIKQEPQDSSYNLNTLKYEEKNYHCGVYVNDEVASNSKQNAVSISTNLGTNLAKSYESQDAQNYIVRRQGVYAHNGHSYSESVATERFQITDIYNKDTKVAYLEASIYVFEHNDLLTSENVSIYNFDTSKALTSLKGSIVN